MRMFQAAVLLLGCLVADAIAARPLPPPELPNGPISCLQAASMAERSGAIPTRLLAAIEEVESVRVDPATHRAAPWPWTINVEGAGHFYETKQDAIAAVRAFQAAGARSIDVGCMQINLMHHPAAFASLEEAFDPQANTTYGARFLRDLYRLTNNWPQAAAFYHSQTPSLGEGYAAAVMARWPSAGKYGDLPLLRDGSRRATVQPINYSVYTPAFAAALKGIDHDLARNDSLRQEAKRRPTGMNGLASARRSPYGLQRVASGT